MNKKVEVKMKRVFLLGLVSIVMLMGLLTGCQKKVQAVVIYTNADEEAIVAMENALNKAGYEDQYILQGMGTSELGGKLIVEGQDLSADLVTMSSYFVESAQDKHEMFVPLTFETHALNTYPEYYTPILANTGSIFVNTEVISAEGLTLPTSIMDLTKDEYAGLVSIPSIMDSSTAWLMMQAIIDAYGEDALDITKALVKNCGPHIESSGSGPIKKVRIGEVAVGFGLRHQAVADQKDGMPIQFIDPIEGNFSLTESIAVVKNDNLQTQELAMKMAEVIIKDARKELIAYYPVALYESEVVDSMNEPGNSKIFALPLTVELLQAHQKLFKEARE